MAVVNDSDNVDSDDDKTEKYETKEPARQGRRKEFSGRPTIIVKPSGVARIYDWS